MDYKNRLFTVSQVAKICNTSRSTILRMEKDEILKPTYVNEESGYRYYGQEGVLRIMRNLSFQNIGMTRKEIFEYYSKNEDYGFLLSLLKKKMEHLKAIVDVLSIETQEKDTSKIDFFSFPENYCFSRTFYGIEDITQARSLMWQVTQEALEKEVSFEKAAYPFFSVDVEQVLSGENKKPSFDITVNIPVINNKYCSRLDNIVHYEATETVTSYLYGGSKKIAESFKFLKDEALKRNIAIIGNARVLSIVKAVPGASIPEEYWVTRICIPIKK